MSVAEAHAAMAQGRLTARRLVEHCLARIQAYDRQGPALNAVLAANPRALEIAEALDARFQASGPVGPLHGIPVLVKDNIDTADLPTTAGSIVLQGHVPREDAAIVERLRRAGAVILAKTNLHEFAMWGETVSSLGGQTRNPYDLTRTPGGSSGGTGAALAAGFGLLGLGTDTINSVRSPASANSLVGLRPTTGLVSRRGLIPYSPTQDTAGPMAAAVADVARLLDVLAGPDPGDPASAAAPVREAGVHTASLDAGGLEGARLGVVETLFGTGPAHREVNEIVGHAIRHMEREGAVAVPVREPMLDAGRVLAEVSVHAHEFAASLDLYLGDLGAGTPVRSLAEVIASGRFHPRVGDEMRRSLTLSPHGPDYEARLRRRAALRERVAKIMAELRLDALVYPHQQRLVVPIGEPQVDRNGVLASVLGFPAITVPGGFSAPGPAAPIGVPVGVEFLGRPWEEPTLLRLAYAFEQATRFRRPPPTTPPLA